MPAQAYAGKVRTDINHDAYKPAAWRVDSYLDESDDDQDVMTSLRSHRIVFSKDKSLSDAMARTEKADDYAVRQRAVAHLFTVHVNMSLTPQPGSCAALGTAELCGSFHNKASCNCYVAVAAFRGLLKCSSTKTDLLVVVTMCTPAV